MCLIDKVDFIASLIAILTSIVIIFAYFIEKRKIYLRQYSSLKREIENNLIAFKYFPYKEITPLTLDNELFKKFLTGLNNDVIKNCLDIDFKKMFFSRQIFNQKLLFILNRINWLKFISIYNKNEVDIVLKRRIETLEKYLKELKEILSKSKYIKYQNKLIKTDEDVIFE